MNHDHSNTNSNTHLWIMLACCLIPLALILSIGIFGISLGSLTPFLPFALILLCPLMMFFMMRGMGHEHGTTETQPPRTSAPASQPQAATDASVNTTANGERCH